MNIKPLIIGGLKIDFPVMLAPMAGYTDAVMRSLAMQFRCGMVFTEVANAEGIARGTKTTLHILDTLPGERPVAAHIYGSNPDSLAQAAAIIEKTGRFQVIDLNCGCPVARIVARGAGAALMKHPEKIARILRAIRLVISLPLTVKTRLDILPGRMNISEIAHAIEEGGAAALTLHARHASARHAGHANWQVLAKIKEERSIPVIGNGGINSADDAAKMFAETGVDGVMIGKAAIGNPWIFSEIWSRLHGLPGRPHSPAEHRAIIEEHLRLLINHMGKAPKTRRKTRLGAEQQAVLHFRGHLLGYIRGFANGIEVRRKLQDMRRMADVLAAVDGLPGAQSG